MKNKKIVEFDLDGNPVYIEIEEAEERVTRAGRGDEGEIEKAESKFTKAIAHIKPAADAILNTFQEMNTPEEIGLEFGLKFNASAGAIFASVDSEATFKVSLKWSNKKESPENEKTPVTEK